MRPGYFMPLPACAPTWKGIKIARTLFVSDMSPFTVCPVKGGHIISAWLCKGPYSRNRQPGIYQSLSSGYPIING